MRTIVFLLACALVGCGGADDERPTAPRGDPLAGMDANELYQRGISAAGSGDYVRAEQYLAASIDRGYPQDRALPSLIEVCVAASRLRAAIDYAEPYLRRHPDKWHLRYLVASLDLGVGEPRRARDELQRVADEQPERADPHYLLAVVLAEHFGDYAGAREHYRRYLELAPNSDKAGEVRASLKLIERVTGGESAGAGESESEGAGAGESESAGASESKSEENVP